MKWYVLIFGVILLAVPALADETPQALTLDQAQRTALAAHPQIKASDALARAAQEDIASSRAAYFPQVTGDAIRAFAPDDTRLAASGSLNNPNVIDRGSFGVGVSQLITDFGRTNAEVDAAQAAFEAQKQRAGSSRAITLLNVTKAYYDALRAQALIKVAVETLKARGTLLNQMTQLRDAKLRSDLDLSIARQGVNDADLLMLRAHNNEDDAMAELSEAMGYGETHAFALAAADKALPPNDTLDSYIAEAVAHNPDLAALQSEYKAAERRATAAFREYYPTLSAVGFAGDTPLRESSQPIDSHYAAGGISLSIPIFTGGRQTAESNKADAEAEAAKMQVEIKKNALVRDIHTLFDNTVTAYKNISVSAEMHQNTRKSLELTQARYDIGKSSIVDLNQAQLAETQAAVGEANATYQYLIQRALLDYAAGKMSLDDLPPEATVAVN